VRDAVGVGAELGVVVAFGRIIPVEVLDQLPIVNLHLSLLPRWRGAAPVERAILAGDHDTGVSIMAIDVGLDTGGVYETIATPIDPTEDAATLGRRLVDLGTRALLTRLDSGIAGLGVARAQSGAATYAEKLTAADRRLDFTESAEMCNRVVRIGGASTTLRGEPFRIHRAEVLPDLPAELSGRGVDTPVPGSLVGDVVVAGSGGLRLIEVQAAGRRAQPFSDFAHGARLGDAERFGAPTAEPQGAQ
jgi:methionyl-tRNA formyltransferase